MAKQSTIKKAEHLYSDLHGIQTTLKCSGMDHTVLLLLLLLAMN